MIRVSSGTAIALGLSPARADVLPATAYLMLGESCPKTCAFCPQGRHPGKVSDSAFLSRVSWQPYARATVLEALRSRIAPAPAAASAPAASPALKRVCLQLTAGPDIIDLALDFAGELLRLVPVPVSLSAHRFTPAQVQRAARLGIDTLCLPLDVADSGLYRSIKGGSWERMLDALRTVRNHFPGTVATHIIVGLGETEPQLLKLFKMLHHLGISFGLFAFTPIPGTPLALRPAPSLQAYRRMQIARWLIVHDLPLTPDFRQEENRQALANLIPGEAFRTSGCPGCNRPYYNEKPQGPWYNFPREPSEPERLQALEQAWL